MMNPLMTLVPLLLSQAGSVFHSYPPPQELYTLSWVGGPFVWPSAAVRNMYHTSGKFTPKNHLATRAVIFRDEVFVTFPRLKAGVGATLARTPLLSPDFQAVFKPFPSWEAQTEGDCDSLQSAVDLYLDRREVLWVLDSGTTGTLDRPLRRCTPKAVGYDLVTGKRLHIVDLSRLTGPTSRLQYLVADVDSQGRHHLFISDAEAAVILVYNVSAGTAYRMALPKSVVVGCPGGRVDVLYIAIAKPATGGRRLYVTVLGGRGLYSIRTEDLMMPSDNRTVDTVSPHKPGRMVLLGTDNIASIYFRYEGKPDVFKWDVNSPLVRENCKQVYAGDCCLLATHVSWDPLRGRMRALMSNFLDYFQGTVGVGVVHVLRSIG